MSVISTLYPLISEAMAGKKPVPRDGDPDLSYLLTIGLLDHVQDDDQTEIIGLIVDILTEEQRAALHILIAVIRGINEETGGHGALWAGGERRPRLDYVAYYVENYLRRDMENSEELATLVRNMLRGNSGVWQNVGLRNWQTEGRA